MVKPADPLMVIVPDTGDCPPEAPACANESLVVEAMAANKDFGFLATGQAVEVKLEAFPFTRYGIIPGKVLAIGQAAIEREGGNLIFPIRVRLMQAYINVNGKKRPLAPGLAITAEIKTGSRRIIDFLLSPLQKRADEAGRER